MNAAQIRNGNSIRFPIIIIRDIASPSILLLSLCFLLLLLRQHRGGCREEVGIACARHCGDLMEEVASTEGSVELNETLVDGGNDR